MKINPSGKPNAIVVEVRPTSDQMPNRVYVRMRSLTEGLFVTDFYVQDTHPVAQMFADGQTVAITFDLGEPPPPPDDGLGIEDFGPVPVRGPAEAVKPPTGGGKVRARGAGGFTVYESEEPQPDPNDLPLNVATPGFPSQSMDIVRDKLGIAEIEVDPNAPRTATMRRSANE